MKPRLYIDQKITAFINRYVVYTANAQGQKAEAISFVEQQRFKFKEKVTFYTDKSKQEIVCTFRAEKVLDIHGKYLVEDANGTLLGYFEKVFGASLLKSTWHLFAPDGTYVFTVTENSTPLALFRRFAGFIPIIGDILELLVVFFKYHFVFLENDQPVGKYSKVTLIRDHYQLDMTDEAYAKLDQRVLLAMGVALDALQSR